MVIEILSNNVNRSSGVQTAQTNMRVEIINILLIRRPFAFNDYNSQIGNKKL